MLKPNFKSDGPYVATGIPPTTAVPSDGTKLKSKWPTAPDLAGNDNPCRLEGEVSDLVVPGALRPNLSGIFYRIMCDPFVPPHWQITYQLMAMGKCLLSFSATVTSISRCATSKQNDMFWKGELARPFSDCIEIQSFRIIRASDWQLIVLSIQTSSCGPTS